MVPRWERLIEAPIIPRVPPEATKVTATTILVLIRKHMGAEVDVLKEATTKAEGLVLVIVAKLRQDESLVKAILTKPMRLPFVNVTVKEKALNNITTPNIPIPY